MKKIVVANRGEIACRLCRTARKMGIATVGIRTAMEPSALYLSYCDEIFDCSSDNQTATVFLDIDRLIAIAHKTGATAIYPGYGFLAENAYFAQKCISEGIVFIGPSPEAIYNMGNKTIARQLAKRYNIPITSGSSGVVENYNEAIVVAEQIGFPIIVKAAAGGGGRGMRIVRSADELEKNLTIAQNEAKKAFDDASIFVEKYIENPKHIEIQILGDKYGNVIHLGERECSIQRKNQKLLEEAPSLSLNDDLRRRMAETALVMAKAVGYYSAGTVEFLLDADNNFYFMEMNTRIQVEHTITEAITGIDIVEQQIRIADGERLQFCQDDISFKGVAIECRINAEDVQSGFIPSVGRIDRLIFPHAENVRIDTGIAEGSSIGAGFDSMIAKMVVWGISREEAIAHTLEALENTVITGVKTTLPFFKKLLTDDRFREGTFSTSFVEKDMTTYTPSTEIERIASAWIATQLYVTDNSPNEDIDFEQMNKLSPWLVMRRKGT